MGIYYNPNMASVFYSHVDDAITQLKSAGSTMNSLLKTLKETFDSNDFFYIIMDLCTYNLTDYVKIRETPLSIDEIRQILIQLNNKTYLSLF